MKTPYALLKSFFVTADGRGRCLSEPENDEIVLLRVIEDDGGTPIEHQMKARYVKYEDGYWAFVRENNSIIIDQNLIDDNPETKYEIFFDGFNKKWDEAEIDICDIENIYDKPKKRRIVDLKKVAEIAQCKRFAEMARRNE